MQARTGRRLGMAPVPMCEHAFACVMRASLIFSMCEHWAMALHGTSRPSGVLRTLANLARATAAVERAPPARARIAPSQQPRCDGVEKRRPPRRRGRASRRNRGGGRARVAGSRFAHVSDGRPTRSAADVASSRPDQAALQPRLAARAAAAASARECVVERGHAPPAL